VGLALFLGLASETLSLNRIVPLVWRLSNCLMSIMRNTVLLVFHEYFMQGAVETSEKREQENFSLQYSCFSYLLGIFIT
jgi:hypothetical protein